MANNANLRYLRSPGVRPKPGALGLPGIDFRQSAQGPLAMILPAPTYCEDHAQSLWGLLSEVCGENRKGRLCRVIVSPQVTCKAVSLSRLPFTLNAQRRSRVSGSSGEAENLSGGFYLCLIWHACL